MQAHHRKQRKKEAERNKKQRIKARDERVVETKTVSGIREEIKKLKYRKNLQSGEKQKLERLEKELKLVKEAARKDRIMNTFESTRKLDISGDLLLKAQSDFSSGRADTSTTLDIIREYNEKYNYVLCPHSAVKSFSGWSASFHVANYTFFEV